LTPLPGRIAPPLGLGKAVPGCDSSSQKPMATMPTASTNNPVKKRTS
jgi:hypothetical protein